jgi:uncharacterized protein (TIGR00251 family)
MAVMECIRDARDGAVIEVILAPRSSRLAIVGIHGGRLKIALTAPPVDGKANDQLVKFFAKQFGVSRDCIQIVAGLKSRKKSILLQGVVKACLAATLDELLIDD